LNRDPTGSALSEIEEESQSQASLHIKNKTAYSKYLTTVASQYLIPRWFKSSCLKMFYLVFNEGYPIQSADHRKNL
jgi:hypothetical protein